MRASLIAGAALLALAACDGEDPVDAALRDAAAARHAAALKTTEEAEATTPVAAPDPDAEAVAVAITDAEADRTRYQALLASDDEGVRRLAKAAIARREAEVSELRAWRAAQD